MIGLVLSGGRSLRMGADKGLLLKGDQTWVEIARKKLSLALDQVIISVNSDQYIKYSNLFAEDILLKDRDQLTVKGPLLGILTCHMKNPEKDLLVIACDLVLMNLGLIGELLNSYAQQPGYEAYVFTHHDNLEPLCGIYSNSGLSRINGLYLQNPNLKNSMKYVLSQLNVLQIPLSEEKQKYFTNFNEPDEMNGL
ncbi:molybdenum cofactor guanylyltransferase [Pedobacter sp. PWIIR3]